MSTRIDSFADSQPRYAALRISGALLTAVGALLLAAGTVLLAMGVYTLVAAGTNDTPGPPPFADPGMRILAGAGGVLSLVWAFGVLAGGLQLVALGSACRLFIQVEENTRASAQALDRIRRRLEPSDQGGDPPFLS